VDADARVLRDRLRQRRPLEADEIHVDAGGGERVRVVQHTRAPPEISEGDDDGSHGMGLF
jgi:hypothetical protein